MRTPLPPSVGSGPLLCSGCAQKRTRALLGSNPPGIRTLQLTVAPTAA